MIPEIGLFSLIVAFTVACMQSTLPLYGIYRQRALWISSAVPLALLQSFFILIAFSSLAYAFLSNDFSVAYVANNSNTSLPTFYRFCAVWGAHEGSLLLWITLLACWNMVGALCRKALPVDIHAHVLAILGFLMAGFLLFLLMTSNPFLRLLPHIPTNGRDLNPLLQDPGLAIHPPILYTGYVGFAVIFAWAITALLRGRCDAVWARWVRPWTLVAWSFLTLGITLGSWWSYRVLGWGGWWFWDPVENASLMPWLVGTALIHSLMVMEKRNTFKSWTVLLAILAFVLSLLGTFLVRSGVLVSVHAFAVDPKRGLFLLLYLGTVTSLALLIYAWRAPRLIQEVSYGWLSRETLLLMNNVLLLVSAASIFLGTIYPLIVDALGWGKLSVGPPYFNYVMMPLMVGLLIAMGLGPRTYWQEMSSAQLFLRLKSVSLGVIAVVFLGCVILWPVGMAMFLGLFLAAWIAVTAIVDFVERVWQRKTFSYAALGMLLAHGGFALLVVGIVVSSHYSVERDVRLEPGQSVTLQGYRFQLAGFHLISGPNYQATQAEVHIQHRHQQTIILLPEIRHYTVTEMAISHVAIQAGFWRDLYVALGDRLSDKAWSFRLYYKPLVRWIWLGGILILLGGWFAAVDRRYRSVIA